MPAPSNAPTIDKRRLMRDLNAIGRIGIGDHGSVTRLVFSIKELRSRQVLIHLMRQAGLKIHVDAIGNIFGRLDGADPKAPALLAGSHLDTVLPLLQRGGYAVLGVAVLAVVATVFIMRGKRRRRAKANLAE